MALQEYIDRNGGRLAQVAAAYPLFQVLGYIYNDPELREYALRIADHTGQNLNALVQTVRNYGQQYINYVNNQLPHNFESRFFRNIRVGGTPKRQEPSTPSRPQAATAQRAVRRRLYNKRIMPYVLGRKRSAMPVNVMRPSKLAKTGISHTIEQHGTVQYTECAWVGIQTANAETLGIEVAQALLRYIMNYENLADYTQGSQLFRPSGYSFPLAIGQVAGIKFWYRDGQTAADQIGSSYTYLLNSGDDFRSVATQVFNNVINNANYGGADSVVDSNRELYGYQLLTVGNQVGPVYVGHKIQLLQDLIINCYSRVVLKVQNITVSDSGSTSTDVVDTNPLEGKIVRFKGQVPQIRDNFGEGTLAANTFFNGMYVTGGMLLPQINPSGFIRAPPRGNEFRNLKHISYIRVDPGKIIPVTGKFKFTGKLTTFIRLNSQNNTNGAVWALPEKPQLGSCIMVALERVVKTSLANVDNVKLNYHYDMSVGARVVKNSRSVYKTGHIDRVAVNFPAA